MKNVFRFLGIALAACSMLVACGDDKVEVIANANDASLGTVTGGGKYLAGETVTLTATPNEGAAFVNWSDGVTENPRTIVVPAEGPVTYTANFVAKGVNVVFDANTWKAADILGADYSTYGLVQFQAFKNYDSAVEPSVQGYIPSTVGTQTHMNNNDYYFLFYYENDNDVTEMSGNQYPNWQPTQGEFTESITAIDLTALTVSGIAQGPMFYLPDYLNEIETVKQMTVNINAAQWENVGKGGKTMKQMGKLYTK